MSFWDDLIGGQTLDGIRANVIAICRQAGLLIDDFITGSVGQQEFEAHTQIVYTYTGSANKLVRAFASLDTATDPGDPDPYDATNVNKTPAPGGLSNYGASTFGTTREGRTFATGTLVFANGGGSARTFFPGGLTFTYSVGGPTPAPTYKNSDGGPTYTTTSPTGTLAANPDGSLTVPAGVSVILPVVADVIGTGSNAPAGNVITLTTTLLGCSVTSNGAILGSDREGADAYRARCRLAPASVSPNGPADAYRYVALGAMTDSAGNVFYFQTNDATTALGVDSSGNVQTFPNATGTPLGINRVYVSDSSTTGIVNVYLAGPSGGGSSIASAVTAFTLLITGVYWPDATTRNIYGATNVTVTVSGTIRAKAGPGVSQASIAAAANSALATKFPTVDLGGFNITAGTGTLYVDYIRSIIESAHPAIYHVALTSPASDISLVVDTGGVTDVAVLASMAPFSSSDVTIT